MRFRFVHAADLHLDSPFAGLGLRDAELRRQLVDATLDAFDVVVQRAMDRGATFLVLAGDLYDGIERGTRAQIRFQSGLRRLSDAGIEVFIAHGNHDPQGGRWLAIRSWPERVHVFSAGNPQTLRVERDGRLLARVHGVSYGTRHEADNLALRFPRGSKGAPDIAVLHCNVGQDPEHGAYSPCTVRDLADRRMTYWALGHIHRHKILLQSPSHIVYSGTTQGRGFNPWDMGAKGAVEVEVADGQVERVSFFPTDQARFLEVDVDLGKYVDLGALHTALVRRGEELAERHDRRLLLIRLKLKGRGALHHVLRSYERRLELMGELEQETASLNVRWTDIADESAAPFDMAALAKGEDLRAALVATAESWKRALPALPPELERDLRAVVGNLENVPLDRLLEQALFETLSRVEQEAT